MAAPMSPSILSLPVMYAVVGFCWPSAIARKVSSEARIVTSASPPPSVTSTAPSATSTFHTPAPSMSKTYELFIPAVLEGSTRVGRESKNSRGSIAARAYRKQDALSGAPSDGGRWGVALDERIRELPLSPGNRDAVPLELDRARVGRAQRLTLGREPSEQVGQRLDGLRRPATSESNRPQRGHARSVYRRNQKKVKAGRRLCKPSAATVETLSDSIAAPMRVEVADAFPEADVLAVPVGQGGIPAGGDLQGAARIAEEEDLAAKAGRTAVLFAEEPSKRVVLVGLGPADELDADTVRTAAASVARATE